MMKQMFIGAMAASALLAAPVPAGAATWEVYRDKAEGCRIEYPARVFRPEAMDDSQNHQRFAGPNDRVYFRVMGVANEDDLSPREIRAAYLHENQPGEVVYQATRNDFLVLSGYRGDSIFYTRVAVSPDRRTLCIVEIAYPTVEKHAFDAIVTRMSRSFRVEQQDQSETGGG